MNLYGKRVLITGGARRVGAVIAEKLASEGCILALHCFKSVVEAEKLLQKLPGTGHQLFTADLSEPAEVEKLISEVGRFDLLVNNASVFFRPGSAEDLAAGKLYRQLNYLTPKRLLEAFYDQKLSEGAAVNMVDSAVLRPGGGAYYESKKALAELTVALSRDFGSCNLRINAIAPGAVLPPHWAPDSPMTKVLSENFLHRAVKCEDLADLALFMLKCDSLTGTVIPLDCGISR